jgi:hypothetical protein
MPDSQPQCPELPFVEALYCRHPLTDPESVPEAWRRLFASRSVNANGFSSRPQLLPSFRARRSSRPEKHPNPHGTHGDSAGADVS